MKVSLAPIVFRANPSDSDRPKDETKQKIIKTIRHSACAD